VPNALPPVRRGYRCQNRGRRILRRERHTKTSTHWMKILQTMHKSDQPSPHERRDQPTVAQSKRILEWIWNSGTIREALFTCTARTIMLLKR
jgi:thiamine kinase-like enzyme